LITLSILFALGCFGLLTSTVFAGMVVAGARFHRSARVDAPKSFTPALTLLKPLHGAEPGLEENLVTFFEQDYPDYEILFCARAEDDAGLAIARRVAERFPQVSARFFSAGEPRAINAKAQSMEVMAAAARHSILVISDSDVRVRPEYLRAVAAPFADPTVGAMTCLYRGVAVEGGLWARLEAVGMSVEMTAGVLVANMLEGMRFVLGPTMAFRTETLRQMGGFAVTYDYCADDFVLGNEAFQRGWKVALSHHSIDHMVLHSEFLASLKHQVRWMKSTRFSRPKGHFGTSLTFSMPFALLACGAALALHWPVAALVALGWGVLTRAAIAWAAGRMVAGETSLVALFVLYPIRDLMGFGFWAASYLSSKVLWRGRVYRLLPGGRMEAIS
jgi:ceramide glucosyltransferase